MDSLEGFQQNRAVIEDFSRRTLAAIPSDFGRLSYICSLVDPQSGRYEHDGLMELYPVTAVQAALKHCHTEMFSRILETSLQEQENDLRGSLESRAEGAREAVEKWREDQNFEELCPRDMPAYLRDLFCSNMNVLLAIYSSGPLS